MNKEQLINYVNCGREIEFKYNNKMYSITYAPAWMEYFISFCEFDKETTDVKTVDELLNVERDGISVLEMICSISEEDIWIF